MAGEWRDQLWGKLAVLKYGKRLSGYSGASGRYRVYGTNGPIGWHDEPLCKHETVVIGRKGAYRGVYYSPEPCFVIDTAFYLEPRVDFDMRWAYYELLTHDINSMDSGSAIPSTSREAFYQLPVRVPPKEEQRAIAHILGTLDDKIELLRRMNETLEAMARALFKSWFVDFDPVVDNALEAGNPIPNELEEKAKRRMALGDKRKPLPEHIRRLFPDRFVDSELGPIPDGWRVDRVGDHMLNLDSKRIPLSRRERTKRRGPYPYYGAAGVIDFVDDYLFDGIFLLVGEDGSVIKDNGTAVTQYVWGKFWVNNHAHVLQGRGSVSTEQLYLYFHFEKVAPYVTGAVQPKLSQGRMNSIPFVFAGDDICRAFSQAVGPLFSKLRANVESIRIFTALRDALLPKLISGELRIPRVEKVLERVNS